MLVKNALAWVVKNPIETICLLLAITLVIFGAYYVLPISIDSANVVTAVFSAPEEHAIVGMVLAAIGGYGVYAFLSPVTAKMHTGIFLISLTYSFLAILRVLVFGWFPIGWVLFLTLAAISGVCYLVLGVRVKDK